MKIVHLIDSMEMGGAEKLVSWLCRQQREEGHEASVHCLYRIGVLGEALRAEGFEVVLHQTSTPAGRPGSIYTALKRIRPGALHCHNATATILGAFPARLAGVKRVVATRHGIVDPPYSLRRELKFAFASRWCDSIVAVCEQARNNLMAAPFAARQKIVCIYNATLSQSSDGATRLSKSGFTLLHVARLCPAKDQDTLLRAFAIAKTRVPDMKLWIVGGGELRPKLEGLAEQIGLDGSVTFFGEQMDASPFFASADLFVLSSVSEGVPVSLLEALAAGLPAVVTDVGGIREVAYLSDATFTVPASNAGALAVAIEKIAHSRNKLPGLQKIARQCHLANFALERMAKEYMELYTNTSCD